MCVKHIWIGALGTEEEFQNLEGVVAVGQVVPEVDAPGGGPAGGLVAANFQRFFRGGGEFRRAAQGDVVAGEKAVEVGDVAMMDVGGLHVPVFQPFLELAGG